MTNPHCQISKDQQDSLWLINIGTAMQYFDFYTYVHISLILNDIFFPASDPYTRSLLLALSFSMAYLLRPVGSLLLGYLGDRWGRKSTIIVSTLIMSASTFTLGCMPTYQQIGYLAPIAVLICRTLQGMCSSIEVVGTRVYTAELVKAPCCYFYTALTSVASYTGTIIAIGICSIFLYLNPVDGWRYVFYLGSGIVLVGCFARTKLKESPEFLDALSHVNIDDKHYVFRVFVRKWSNVVSYFAIELKTPILFFITFVHMGEYLSTTYGYSANQIIHHNFFILVVSGVIYVLCAFLTRSIYPLTIIKFMSFTLLFFSFFFPSLISLTADAGHVFIIQCVLWGLNITGIGSAIFVRGFPVIGRYTIVGVTYSISRALTAVVTSYACVWLASLFGFMGVTLLLILTIGLHLIGLYKFVPCEEDQWIEAHWKSRFRLNK